MAAGPLRLPSALAAAAVALCACARERPPDVLLVVLDAVRADRLGVAGYPLPTTPQLDRLAARGVWFADAYSAATWTKPAMASQFVSRYPSEHGVVDFPAGGPGPLVSKALAHEFETLAEHFAKAGYATGAVANQVHLSPENGYAQGFSDFVWSRGKKAEEVNRRALALLERLAGTGRPYFAWLHYIDAHSPHNRSLGTTRDAFGPTKLGVRLPRGRRAFLAWEAAGVPERAARALAARYDREISYLDHHLGELFTELQRRGWLDDTLVVVTADHGEGFGEHGRLRHGFAPYEEVARVPLIVAAPRRFGFPAGVRRTPVALLDLAPTLLDLAGLEPDPGHRGASLRAVLGGREAPQRSVVVETEVGVALRRGAWKLLVPAGGAPQLFDLGSDPGETRDLAAAGCAGPCAELLAELRAWRAGLALPPHVEPHEIPAADRAALESLGYL